MLGIYVTVPIASFRKGFAQEYLETEQIPPPATCYGFLLSLVLQEPVMSPETLRNTHFRHPVRTEFHRSAQTNSRNTTMIHSLAHEPPVSPEPPLRVMALHALLYCERLFYLEEVEEIRVADAVVLHGFGQVTSQAIQLCSRHGIPVQWFTAGGRFVAGTSMSPGKVQQRIRQYEFLTQSKNRLRLAQTLVHAKVETQLRYLLRATRGRPDSRRAEQNHGGRR